MPERRQVDLRPLCPLHRLPCRLIPSNPLQNRQGGLTNVVSMVLYLVSTFVAPLPTAAAGELNMWCPFLG